MSCEPSWRAGNRLDEVATALKRLDLLRRTHSVAVTLNMPMVEILAIARAEKAAEEAVNTAVRAYGRMRLIADQAEGGS